MKLEQLALPAGDAGTPTPRTTRSYLLDAIVMALYLLAIAVCAMFLDIPHPLIVAALIAFVTLVFFNPLGRNPSAKKQNPSANR